MKPGESAGYDLFPRATEHTLGELRQCLNLKSSVLRECFFALVYDSRYVLSDALGFRNGDDSLLNPNKQHKSWMHKMSEIIITGILKKYVFGQLK